MKRFILLSLLFVSTQIFAQTFQKTDPISVPTPNASSLGEYGKIPVSLNTGMANVNIPLYEVKEHGLTVPISLSYYSGGVRPEEQPSWVGLGWTVKAGGTITRKVNDISDDFHNDYIQKKGYYYSYSILDQDQWYNWTQQDIINDIQPDEFNFNFLNFSGTFYFDHKGTVKVKCDEPLFVDKNDISIIPVPHFTTDRMFFKFVLRDANGIKYTFGNTIESIEFTRRMRNEQADCPVATSWGLTKIEDPFGNIISLNYIRGNLIPTISYYQSASNNVSDNGAIILKFDCNSSSQSTTYRCTLLEPSYLETITTSKSKVWFYSTSSNDLEVTNNNTPGADWNQFNGDGSQGFKDITGKSPNDFNITPYAEDASYGIEPSLLRKRKKLNQIVVFPNAVGIECPDNDYHLSNVPTQTDEREELMNNGKYFIDFNYIEEPDRRLMLEKIRIHDNIWVNDHYENESFYDFCYYDDPTFKLPPYNTFKIDHWGFYNGHDAIYDGDNYFEYYSQRQPDTNVDHLKEGMLKRVTYPTGGYTIIDYEPHDYKYFFKRIPYGYSSDNSPIGLKGIDIAVTSNTKVSGLRIKTVTSSSNSNSIPVKKNYYYTTSLNKTGLGQSSGYLMNIPMYYWHSNLQCIKDHDGKTVTVIADPLGLLDLPVGVAFETTIGSLFLNLKSILSPLSELINDLLTSPPVIAYSSFCNNSLLPLSMTGSHILYSKVIEEDEGGGYEVNTFTMPKAQTPNDLTIQKYQDVCATNSLGANYFGQIISFDLERGKLLKNEVYNKNDIKVTQTDFIYDENVQRFKNNVRSKSLNIINLCGGGSYYSGEAIVIPMYSFKLMKKITTDFLSGKELITSTEFNYTSNNQLREQIVSLNNQKIKHTLMTYPYDYNQGSPFIDILNTNRIFKPIETIEYLSDLNGSNGMITRGSINECTVEGNGLLSIHFLLEPTNGFISLNDFKFSNKSLAGILPMDESNGSSYSKYSGDKGLYALESSFDLYNSSGSLTQSTDRSGLSRSYIWGYNNSQLIGVINHGLLDNVKSALDLDGIDYDDLTSTIVDETSLRNIFKNLRDRMPSSLITSFTYDPFYGVQTSKSDERKNNTFFAYDKMGRLSSIKDNESKILKSIGYHFDTTLRPCCDYYDYSNFFVTDVIGSPDYLYAAHVSLDVKNTGKCDMTKTITFSIDGQSQSIARAIPKNTTQNFSTDIEIPFSWENEKKVLIDGSLLNSLVVPKPVDFKLKESTFNNSLPSSVRAGNSISMRCILENVGITEGSCKIRFLLSNSITGENPIVSTTIFKDLLNGHESEIQANMIVPSDASGTYDLIIECYSVDGDAEVKTSSKIHTYVRVIPPLDMRINITRSTYTSSHFGLCAYVTPSQYAYTYQWVANSAFVNQSPATQCAQCSMGTESRTFTVTVTCISPDYNGESKTYSQTIDSEPLLQ